MSAPPISGADFIQEAAAMRGSLRGYVVQSDELEPVVGVLVGATRPLSGDAQSMADTDIALDPEFGREIVTRTDSFGSFAFDDLTEGEWVLRVRGSFGGLLSEKRVQILDNSVSEATIDIRTRSAAAKKTHASELQKRRAHGQLRTDLAPVASDQPDSHGVLRGRVVRAGSREPVADATIVVLSAAGPAPDIAPMTDKDGWFTLDDLPSGEWRLRALGPEGEGSEVTVAIRASALTQVIIEVAALSSFPAPQQGCDPPAVVSSPLAAGIRGRVVRADNGEPVADAMIVVVRGAGPAPSIAPVTGSDGYFALDDLTAGAWILRADTSFGETGEAEVHISGRVTAEVTIKVARKRPRGGQARSGGPL